MQDIANATFNYSTLNEIMPMIYKRFTEKTAEEWRQIYKGLQLLEFLVKNGSERVIDDARSHLSLLKMLRQFHFVDLNGKDQGINVRNRAKELAELLGDVERIRSERKKARATRNKYGGVEGGAGLGASSTSSGRYGGHGNDPQGGYGGYSGGVYGDGGGFGGEQDSYETSETQPHREKFEEYDENDESSSSSRRRKTTVPATTSASAAKRTATDAAAKKELPKPKEPEVDLFDFNDDDVSASAAPAAHIGGAPAAMPLTSAAEEDDFDDFQSAATPAAIFTQPPASKATTQGSSINNMFTPLSPPPSQASTTNYSAFSSPPPPATISSPPSQPIQPQSSQASFQAPRPAGYQASQPNYYQSVSLGGSAAQTGSSSGITSSAGSIGKGPATKKLSSGVDPFASLMVGGGAKKTGQAAQKGPALADMVKQKASEGIWGAPARPAGQNGGGDLLG